MMFKMAGVLICFILLLGSAPTAVVNQFSAEDVTVYNKISIQITDQTGAFIPYAHITIVDLARGSISQMAADAAGRAEFLSPNGGQYKTTITAPGFMTYAETFKVESNVAKHVTLRIGDSGSGYPLFDEERIQPERLSLTIEIPQQPLESMPVPPRRFRHSRWRGL